MALVERKENEPDENFTRQEFGYSAFKRSFTLPETINEDKILRQEWRSCGH